MASQPTLPPNSSASLSNGSTNVRPFRVALMPGARRPPKPNPVTVSPMPDPIDLIYEVTTNLSSYYVEKKPGADWLSIVSLPPPIRTTLHKLRSSAPSLTRPPGFHPVLCCAITHGLSLVLSHSSVSDHCRLRDHFYSLPQLGTPSEEFIAQYLDLRIDPPFQSGSRVNVPIPTSLRESISSAAASMGCSTSFLAVLSTTTLLATQDSVPLNYRTEMQRQCAQYYALLTIKNSGLEALVDAL